MVKLKQVILSQTATEIRSETDIVIELLSKKRPSIWYCFFYKTDNDLYNLMLYLR